MSAFFCSTYKQINQVMSLPNSSQPFFGGSSFVVFIPPPFPAALGSGTVCCRKSFPCCRDQTMFKNVFVRTFAPDKYNR